MSSKVPLPITLIGSSIVGAAITAKLYPQHLPERPLLPLFGCFLAVGTAVAFVYYVFIYPFFVSPLRRLPHAKDGNLLLGHGYVALENPRGGTFLKWMKTIPNDGLIYHRGYLNADRLLVTNHEALRELLVTKAYDFEKPTKLRDILRDILGDGLVVVEGEEHGMMRKNLMPSFSFRNIKNLYPIFWRKSIELIDVIAQQAADQQGKNVPLHSWANKVTMDIIGLAAMGGDFNCMQTGRTHPLVSIYEEILDPTFEKQLYFVARVFGNPGVTKKIFYRIHGRTSKIIHQLVGMCKELVQSKRASIAAESPDTKEETSLNNDILGSLIRHGGFSDRQLIDHMCTFLAAGHETTSSTFTWTTYLLSKYPEIQTALRAELAAALPSLDPNLASATDLASVLESLPLLHGICQETIRLYPTVPITVRVANKDTSLQGMPVARGTQVVIAPYATNRDPALWGADAEQFNPERWIETDPKTGQRRPNNSGGASSNFALLTFLHGPRSCIGQGFSRAELRCLVAAFVARFEIGLEKPDETILPAGAVTLKPESGMFLKLRDLGVNGVAGEKKAD